MKITKSYLRQIIKEEYNLILAEQNILAEQEVLNEKLNWKSIGAGLFMAANLFSSPASAYGHAKNKQQAIEFANKNPGEIFDYTEIKPDGTKVVTAIARGISDKADQSKSTFVNTGIAQNYVESADDLMKITPEEGFALLNDYLERYQNNPKFKQYVLKNKSDAFLDALSNTNADVALRKYDKEFKNLENDEIDEKGKEFLMGGFNLAKKLLRVDLGLEDL